MKKLINEVNRILEDLDFPPTSVSSGPNFPETDRVVLDDTDDYNSINSRNHYTEEELALYRELIILNNNYISTINGMLEQISQDGWSERKLSELGGAVNAFQDSLYKFGNENQTKVNSMSDDAKKLIVGEYWNGLKHCRNYVNLVASIVIDPDINSEESVTGSQEKGIKSISNEELLNDIHNGKIPFTPKSDISDNAKKKLNDTLNKMKSDANNEKLTLSKAILGLQITQDLIQAAAYTNPLTAVVYEMYQTIFKPIKDMKKELKRSKAKEQIKNFETLKKILDEYRKQNNISLKDLDKYIQARKNNKNKLIQDRSKRIGTTNYFLMEQYLRSKNVKDKFGKEIGLEELEIYLLDAANNDEGDENTTRKELVKKHINQLRYDYDISKDELSSYYNAWNNLSDTRNRRPVEMEYKSKNTSKIGTITVKDFSKQLSTDKTLSNPDKLITIEEFKQYLEEVVGTELDSKRTTNRNKSKNAFSKYKEQENISDEDIKSYIKDRQDNNNKFISNLNPDRKVGKASISDFEDFLLANGINDLQLLIDINKGDSMDETLQMGQRFPLTYLTGKKKSDFSDNQAIIDYIEDSTDYTVIKDNGNELEVIDITKPNRPVDVITLNECMLCNVEEIGDGIVVFMPSGFEAELTIEDDTVNVDYYTHNDTYSVDEFGKIIKDGILKFNEPSSIMESNYAGVTLNGKDNIKIDFDTRQAIVYITINDELIYKIDEDIFMNNISDYVYNLIDKDEREFTLNWDKHFGKLNRFLHKVNEDFDYKPNLSKHAEVLNKLDRIQKVAPSKSKEKQNAVTLMDASGLGVDVSDEAGKLQKKVEKMNELSDELVNKVSQERLTNFVNSETEEEQEENYKKLRKNILLNKNRKKAQMADISETIRDIKEMLEDLDMTEDNMDEISDEPVYNSNASRFHNVSKANKLEKEKYGKYKNIRDRLDNFNIENSDIEELDALQLEKDAAEEEWAEAQEELAIAKDKFENNVKHVVNREFRKFESNDDELEDVEEPSEDKIEIKGTVNGKEFEVEAELPSEDEKEELLEDIGGLTDVKDVDLPKALADTIEVTDEGTVLTLETLYAEMKALKSEMTSAIQSLKDSFTAQLDNAKNDITKAQEDTVLQDIDNKVDELGAEINNAQDDNIEQLDKEPEENTEQSEEDSNATEEGMGESFHTYNKFRKTGLFEGMKKLKKNEDLNKIKAEVDKAVAAGKDAKTIQNTIDMNAKDDTEKDEGRQYAVDKMSEEKVNAIIDKLHASRSNCALSNIRYHK